MKSRLLKIPFLISLFFFTTGCWNFERLSERGLVTGIALDKADRGYRIGLESIQFGKSQSGAGQGSTQAGKPYVLVSKTDKESLESALHGTQYRFVGLAFFPDYRILIIGKELAKHGMKPIFDHQIRDPDMRRNTQMIIAEESAIDLLKIQPRETHFAGEYLEGLVKRNEKSGHVLTADIGHVFRAMVENATAVIPLVRMAKDKKGAKVETLAVIKDFKLVDVLSHRESEYVSLLQNVYKKNTTLMYSLVFPCKNEKNSDVAADIIKSKAKLEPKVEDGHLTISGKLKLTGYLSETSCGNGRIEGNSSLEEIEEYMEKEMQKKIKKHLEEALHRSGADLLDLQRIFRRNSETWDQVKDHMDELMKTANVDVNVEIELILKGTET